MFIKVISQKYLDRLFKLTLGPPNIFLKFVKLMSMPK